MARVAPGRGGGGGRGGRLLEVCVANNICLPNGYETSLRIS
jgi:hypothetical protein